MATKTAAMGDRPAIAADLHHPAVAAGKGTTATALHTFYAGRMQGMQLSQHKQPLPQTQQIGHSRSTSTSPATGAEVPSAVCAGCNQPRVTSSTGSTRWFSKKDACLALPMLNQEDSCNVCYRTGCRRHDDTTHHSAQACLLTMPMQLARDTTTHSILQTTCTTHHAAHHTMPWGCIALLSAATNSTTLAEVGSLTFTPTAGRACNILHAN